MTSPRQVKSKTGEEGKSIGEKMFPTRFPTRGACEMQDRNTQNKASGLEDMEGEWQKVV